LKGVLTVKLSFKWSLILCLVWFTLLASLFIWHRVSLHKKADRQVSLAVMSREEAVSRLAGGIIRLPKAKIIALQYGADVLIPDNDDHTQAQLIVEYSQLLVDYWGANACRVTGSEIRKVGKTYYWIYTVYPTTMDKKTKPDFRTTSLGKISGRHRMCSAGNQRNLIKY
jgi:hypothetical protein